MGFFANLKAKKAQKNNVEILAPVKGKLIETAKISDATFAENLLGATVGIVPTDGHINCPISGKVEIVHQAGHAFAIKHESGLNVMVHIGIDTVNMNMGKKEGQKLSGFDPKIKVGDMVVAGQIAIEADLAAIKKAKYETTTMTIVMDDEGLNGRKFELTAPVNANIDAGVKLGVVA